MNATLIAQIFGWLQFLLPVATSVASTGGPHGFTGWATTLGSLAAAVGIHAASTTGGTPKP